MSAPSPWSKDVRDRWFFLVLGASTLSVAWLLSPFVYVVGSAAVTVVVTWPLYERVLVRVRGNRAVAAVLSALILAGIIFGPLGFLVYLFVQQAIAVVGQGLDFVNSGEMQTWITWALEMPKDELVATVLPAWADPYVTRWVPAEIDFQKMVAGPVKDAALATLNAAGGAVPALLNSTVNAGMDAVLYVGTVVSLYMEGPAVLRILRNLAPVESKYQHRLWEVFREFSNNMVLGALGTAAAQSVAAGVGYTIAGVDRVFFYAILTGVFSFIPFVGTAIVWIPLALMVAVQSGIWWGVFLAVWSIAFTGQIDNLVRPLFMRGSTEIHPMLIFLSVFGGMAWLGIPGALIGPVVVSLFLALYTLYAEDFLGEAPEAVLASEPPSLLSPQVTSEASLSPAIASEVSSSAPSAPSAAPPAAPEAAPPATPAPATAPPPPEGGSAA